MKKIGQQEVLDCLEKGGKAMSARQIAELLGDNDKKIYPLLNKLMKWDEIYAKEVSCEVAIKKFGCKRRMYVYSSNKKWLKNI